MSRTTIHDVSETVAIFERQLENGLSLEYRLQVLQQPERARACGMGAKCTPPPLPLFFVARVVASLRRNPRERETERERERESETERQREEDEHEDRRAKEKSDWLTTHRSPCRPSTRRSASGCRTPAVAGCRQGQDGRVRSPLEISPRVKTVADESRPAALSPTMPTSSCSPPWSMRVPSPRREECRLPLPRRS